MPNRRLCTVVVDNDNAAATTVQLSDGLAEVMGEGMFIIFQTEPNGTVNQIVISEADLRKLLFHT